MKIRHSAVRSPIYEILKVLELDLQLGDESWPIRFETCLGLPSARLLCACRHPLVLGPLVLCSGSPARTSATSRSRLPSAAGEDQTDVARRAHAPVAGGSVMTILYVLLAGAALFALSRMLVIRSETRHAEEALFGSEDSTLGDEAADLLALELGARIFSCEDSRLIGRETSRKFARWFDSERRALALDWLDEVRIRVRGAVREHRRAASRAPGLSPTSEIKVLFQRIFSTVVTKVPDLAVAFPASAGIDTLSNIRIPAFLLFMKENSAIRKVRFKRIANSNGLLTRNGVLWNGDVC
jgi:hypothetical protein